MPTFADTPIGMELKAYEDALDAIVCASVAICALDGRAPPFGDEASAIWIPFPMERLDSPLPRPIGEEAFWAQR